MKPIDFGKEKYERYSSTVDYSDLIDSMEYEVITNECLGSYQGDYLYFVRDGERYGLLLFGYGSCSGCDALQGCDSEKEVIDLRDNIHENIKWFKSKAEVLDFIERTNTKAFRDWWYYDDEGQKFLDKVAQYCKKEN